MASIKPSSQVQEKAVNYSISKPSNPSSSNLSARQEISPYPWLNTRKRARNHEPTRSHDSLERAKTRQESYEVSEASGDRKRTRRVEPPVSLPEEAVENQHSSANPSKPTKRSPSPSSEQHDVASKRPSKFLEGSMHDRTSNKPPSLYIQEDDAMEHPSTSKRPQNPTQNRHASLDGIGVYYDAGIESSKSSSMYRFGKALVNVFKPVAGWRGFGGGKEHPTNTEKNVMQARQIRAEKEYAELKKNGFVGTQPTFSVPPTRAVPAIKYEVTIEEPRSAPHPDSGIDMESSQSSSERKSDGQGSQPDAGLVPSLLAPTIGRAPSPLAETSSQRKAPAQFRKPSFQTLKKVKSHIQLPSGRRPSLPATDSSFSYDKVEEVTSTEQSVRKQPSRKEIVKQQRLSKKISDLENQLEIARRNLKLSLIDGSITPSADLQTGTKTFVPGILPSLPSERALKSYISPEKGENSHAAASKQTLAAFSELQDLGHQSDTVMADPTAQLYQELQDAFFNQTESQQPRAEQNGSKKRKTDERDGEDPEQKSDKVIEGELESVKRPKLRRSERQSSKTQKAIDADVGGRRKRNLNSRTPRNSPLRNVEPVPPLPAALDFDPVKVDQTRIMSMRSACTVKTPFGKHSEDINNLRKDFPKITEQQLAEYIGSVSENSKITNHTSLSHHNQSAAPVLGPPRSASPIKAKPLKTPDPSTPPIPGQLFPGLSPLAEDEVKAPTNNVSTNGVASTTSPSGAENLPLSEPASELKVSALHVSANNSEKPLPNIQKEEYEWPEDVF